MQAWSIDRPGRAEIVSIAPTKNPLARWSEGAGLGVVDGGLATELERRGHDLSSSLWSARLLADDPGAIEAVHVAYLEAGADVIVSASYQATIRGFCAHGYSDDDARQLLCRSVEIACRARDQRAAGSLVAASIGPYGAFLADGSEYRGDYELGVEELLEFHRERWSILAASGADLLACETIPSGVELEALARLQAGEPEQWSWFTFSCRGEQQLRDGTPLVACLERLQEVPRIAGVGVNCVEPGHVLGIVELQRPLTRLPIIVYPNSGETWNARARCWEGQADAVSFGELARRWRQAGADLIGGCCRTGPQHVRAVRQSV